MRVWPASSSLMRVVLSSDTAIFPTIRNTTDNCSSTRGVPLIAVARRHVASACYISMTQPRQYGERSSDCKRKETFPCLIPITSLLQRRRRGRARVLYALHMVQRYHVKAGNKKLLCVCS